MDMDLPNYFIADLSTENMPNRQMLTDACLTLKRNRQRYLQARSTASLIRTLANVAEHWTYPHYPIRQYTFEHGPSATGFPSVTLEKGLLDFMSEITEENLQALIEQDLGHLRRMDEPCANASDRSGQRMSMALGPELIMHITAGNLPNSVFSTMLLGLLSKSSQLVKCATGTSFLTRMFAHSIYDTDPKLGACLEIAEWPGGEDDLEQAVYAEADLVTVTGSDATISAVRKQLPEDIKLLAYGHKVSACYISKGALQGFGFRALLNRAVDDIVAWNQLGCLSPHVIYVEENPELPPIQFAERLADYLKDREIEEPRGPLSAKQAAPIAARRSFYDIRAAHTPGTFCWKSEGSTDWTLIFEEDPLFQVSCLHRFIYVKRVENIREAIGGMEKVHGKVSTIGLAASPTEANELVEVLAQWGVQRVCPMGSMQKPPLCWRHDGRPALADLLTWMDWEI
jgi:hypothetical protein